ncbi:MAG TPA: hypothetical protein VEY12_12330 [Thermoplasmata archaeon]|nr:hypothetical protein [Thermoplasmata archaeon]
MPYVISSVAQAASAAAVVSLAALLLTRHVLLPRFDETQLRRFEAPLILLFGVFVVYLIANFLAALP